MKHGKTLLTLIIGIIIVIALFMSIDLNQMLVILSQAKIEFFILAGIFYLINAFILAVKINLVKAKNMVMSIKDIFFSSQGGMLLSDITPGRAGYAYTSYSMAVKTNTSVSENLGRIGLIQGLMMATKVIMLLIAFIYFSFFINIPTVFLLAVAVPIAIVVIMIIILYTKASHKILSKIPLLNKITKYLDLMQTAVKQISKKNIAKILVLDFIAWFFVAAQFYFIASALNIELAFITSFMLVPLLSTLNFIPISPAGLGLTESGNVILFTLLGFSPVIAVSFALLWRINNIVFDIITGLPDLKYVKLPDKIIP